MYYRFTKQVLPVLLVLFVVFIIGMNIVDDMVAHANGSMQGEKNVAAQMQRAKQEFGKRDDEAYSLFRYKVQKFETEEGFQGEAELEAARRVLNIHPGEIVCLFDNSCDD